MTPKFNVITFLPSVSDYLDRFEVLCATSRKKNMSLFLFILEDDLNSSQIKLILNKYNVNYIPIKMHKKPIQKFNLYIKTFLLAFRLKGKTILHDHFYWLTPIPKFLFLGKVNYIYQSFYAYQIEYLKQILLQKQPYDRIAFYRRIRFILTEFLALLLSDHIILQSKNLNPYINFFNKPFSVVSNSINIKKNLYKNNNTNPFTLCAINRWYISKGTDIMKNILLWKKNSEINKNIRIIIGGPNSSKILNNLDIDSNYIENNIIYVGNDLSNQEIDEYYRKSDVSIFPSLFEGSPRTILEAMSYGVPTIAFDLPGNLEYNRNNNLFIAPLSNDSAGIIDLIKILFMNPDKYKEASRRNISAVNSYFTIEITSEQLYKSYTKCILNK